MLATKIAKLLYANRVTAIGVASYADGLEYAIWRVPKLMTPINAEAVTIGDLVLTTSAAPSANLLFHEATHVRQWRMYGTLGFLLRYCGQFLKELSKLILAGNYDNLIYKAYYNITLEGEARANEGH